MPAVSQGIVGMCFFECAAAFACKVYGMRSFILTTCLFAVAFLGLGCGEAARVGGSAESREPRIDAQFPGGNIIVDRIDGDRVFLRPDRRDTPRWWFYWYCRVRGAAGRTLLFTFTDGNPVGVRGPAVSTDGGASWTWLGAEAVAGESFRYTFPPQADDVRFCFTIPYLVFDWRAFLKPLAGNPHLQVSTLCKTTKGRDVQCLRVGRLDGKCSHRVLLTARHHACETMANFVLEGLIQSVLTDADQAWFRENVEFLVVPFVDTDGVEDGDQGKCRAPRDPNRDYDGQSIYPAVKALRELVPGWSAGKLRVALDLHCPYIRGGRNEAIFFVGLDDDRLWRNLERFSAILESLPPRGLPYRAADNLPWGQEWNNSAKLGEGKSLADWASQIPGLEVASTMETAYANDAGTPVTPASARAFGRDLAQAIRRFLEQPNSRISP